MAEHTYIILGERVLIHTISCATIVFEKSYVYNSAKKRDSIDALNFITNNSGLHIIIETFGLGYNSQELIFHFVRNLVNKYGKPAEEYVQNSSISTLIRR